MEEEEVQQRVTFLLQQIDSNICAAHRCATKICANVRKHHQILKKLHEKTQVWRPLFESFIQQPTTSKPAMSITVDSVDDQVQESDAQELESKYNVEPADLEVDDHEFKTCVLKKHADESMEESSLNMSMGSDKLPPMSRTPYIKTPAGGHGFLSEDRFSSRSSPRFELEQKKQPWTSGHLHSNFKKDFREQTPLGKENIEHFPGSSRRNHDFVHAQIIETPAIEVNKNLMKVGAFEYTPLPSAKSKHTREAFVEDFSPTTPEMPKFSTVAAQSSIVKSPSIPRKSLEDMTDSMLKKRRRLETESTGQIKEDLTTPHKETDGSPSFRSPQWRPGTALSGLRRKFSSQKYSTPSSSHKYPRRSIESSVNERKEEQESLEEPLTPTFEMASPLLCTKLKAMTPHTPLSNRLAGASLDIGSMAQEARVHDYEESFNSGEPAPQFELSLFPAAFQRGTGAVQISSLYSKFHGNEDNNKPALNVDQLCAMLPDYGSEKIEILLDTLVSRRLLRPFVVEGIMFWQLPL